MMTGKINNDVKKIAPAGAPRFLCSGTQRFNGKSLSGVVKAAKQPRHAIASGQSYLRAAQLIRQLLSMASCSILILLATIIDR